VPLDVRCATNNDRILAVLQLVEMGHNRTSLPHKSTYKTQALGRHGQPITLITSQKGAECLQNFRWTGRI
jgi:hypothetical protein